MKPFPFEGTQLIPLNQMDSSSELYKRYAQKYIGREDLMRGVIPKLECRWNDVIQFSAVNPQLIVDHLKNIEDDFKISRGEYFKVHIDQIIGKYNGVVFDRRKKQPKGDFVIYDHEIQALDHSYSELKEVPKETINFWKTVKKEGGKFLWFAFVPHILIKGKIDIKDFEVCSLKLS